MRSTVTIMSLISVFILCAGVSTAKTVDRFYVSVDGNDEWSGRLSVPNAMMTDGPFATIKKAQKAIRSLKNYGLRNPVEVIVRKGTYFPLEQLVFTPDDSGSAESPITYKAEKGANVIISGGKPITGWTKGEDGVWSAPVPDAIDGKWNFKLLRVGDKWATRARHPNYDPKNPIAGGWLFAQYGGEPWEKGVFGQGLANTQVAGCSASWNVRVPAAGKYRVWLNYGHNMKAFGEDDMNCKTTLSVDGGEPVYLDNLPDTGKWDSGNWSQCAEIDLPAGTHTIKWTNVKGGGINLDAFALCTDPSWDPKSGIYNITSWGSYDVKEPPSGEHLILIQAEACDKVEGGVIEVAKPELGGRQTHMCFADGALPVWSDVSGAEVHTFPAWGWVSAVIPVDHIEYDRKRVVFALPGAYQDIRPGNRFYIENVREALDAPGEWFLDAKQGRIYYISDNKKFPNVPVVAPRFDKLIVLEGDRENGRYVEHINFEGFTFRDTDYNIASDYYTPQDSTILMSGARSCAVRDCNFDYVAGYALHLNNGSNRIEFTGNTVQYVGQGGVLMTGDNSSQAHHNFIAGNIIRNIGLIYKHVAGIYMTTASDNTVIHNTISDVPRYGISYKTFSDDATSERNRIEFNDIRRTNLETNDSGAIENFSGSVEKNTGNILRYNLILDSIGFKTASDGQIHSPHITWGIYLDNNSSGTLVYGNIIARNDWGGVCVHNGKDNRIENNIIIEGRTHQVRMQPLTDFMKGNKFLHNIVFTDNPIADLVYCYPWSYKRDRFTEWDSNLYWLNGADLSKLDRSITPEGRYSDWTKAGYDANSIIADPMFVDPENDDYRLKSDTPASKIGFQRIPVEKIGAEYWLKHNK